MQPTPDTLYKRTDNVIGADVGGNLVLLHTLNWHYLEFTGVGAAIWQLLETPRTFAELLGLLTTRFEVDPVRCAQETGNFLREMTADGLVAVANA